MCTRKLNFGVIEDYGVPASLRTILLLRSGVDSFAMTLGRKQTFNSSSTSRRVLAGISIDGNHKLTKNLFYTNTPTSLTWQHADLL